MFWEWQLWSKNHLWYTGVFDTASSNTHPKSGTKYSVVFSKWTSHLIFCVNFGPKSPAQGILTTGGISVPTKELRRPNACEALYSPKVPTETKVSSHKSKLFRQLGIHTTMYTYILCKTTLQYVLNGTGHTSSIYHFIPWHPIFLSIGVLRLLYLLNSFIPSKLITFEITNQIWLVTLKMSD
jgi:hypothetical protein